MQRPDLAKTILILGLTFVFGYFGIDKIVHPEVWINWIPPWMEGLVGITRNTWLEIIAVSEIIMAIMLIIPVRAIQMTGTVIITLHLAGILTQVGWNDIAVRDIGILAANVALFLLL